MKRIAWLPLALLIGCTGPSREAASPTGEVSLGMNPVEVAAALGQPNRQTSTGVGDTPIEVVWTYKRPRHVVLKDAAGDRDFPEGCLLVFGGDGRRLTEVRPLGIPEVRTRPPAPPPVVTTADPKALVEALMSRPPQELQGVVDAVMLRFPDCLPALVGALSAENQLLPEGTRLLLPALPGQPPERVRRLRPSSRMALLLGLLNQGTGEHFGVLEKPEDLPALAAQWKAWLDNRQPPRE